MSKPLSLLYRPKTFSDFVGNEINAIIIKKAISKNRLHNSLLFAGLRGTGKTSLARVVAKALSCEKEKVNPCNKCLTCKDIDLDRFRDVIELDAATNRKVRDIEELNKTLQYQPQEGNYKIYIIDECHNLTKKAWDVLLKPIEQGLNKIQFIFCTTELNKVPDTIISRSQLFRFKEINKRDIYKRINYINNKEKFNIDNSILKNIASKSQGSMRDSLNLLEQVYISYDNKDIVNSLLKTLSNKEIKKIIKSFINLNMKQIMDIINKLEIPFEEIIKSILKFATKNANNKKFMKAIGVNKLKSLIYIFSDVLDRKQDNKLALEILLYKYKFEQNSKNKGVW